jgi:hypothetical protein
MASSTRDHVMEQLSDMPEEYMALSACFLSAVHDLSSGRVTGHEERLQQLADSYFVLVMEAIRGAGGQHFVSPGIIRYMAHKVSAEDPVLSVMLHRGDLVEMVYQQFEERLWSLLRDVFSEKIALPHNGPVDLLCPVLGISLSEGGAALLCFDDIPSLKRSASSAVSAIATDKVVSSIFNFMELMISMTDGKAPLSVKRTRDGLVAFLEAFILELSGDLRTRACALLNHLKTDDGRTTQTLSIKMLN